MLRIAITIVVVLQIACSQAQPDTLYYRYQGAEHTEAVQYSPLLDTAAFTRTGNYKDLAGQQAVSLHYSRGKPSGLYKAFYPNNQPMIKAVYGWGALHGDWTEYDEAGNITVKGQYRQGKRDGKWYFRSEGILGNYKKGLRHGKWKHYEGTRISKIEKYHRGKLIQGGTFLFGKPRSN